MDILYLLDQLEEVLGGGTRLPFTSRKLVDEQECLDILDQIRVAIPEEIKAARRVAQERERLVAEARTEAEHLLSSAERQLEGRVAEHALVRAAQERAAEIQEDAMQEADRTRRDADTYAYRVLQRLREQVGQIDEVVARGLDQLTPSG